MTSSMRHSQSTDILFPEDGEQQLNDSFYSSAPSNADTYSSYSQEVKYMFENQYPPQYPSPQYSQNSNSSYNSPKQYSPSYQHAKQYSKKFSPGFSLNNNTTPLSCATVSQNSRNSSSSASSHSSNDDNASGFGNKSGFNNNNNNTRHPITQRAHLNRSLDSFPNSLSFAEAPKRPPPPYSEDIYSAAKPARNNTQKSPLIGAMYTPKGPPPPYPGHKHINPQPPPKPARLQQFHPQQQQPQQLQQQQQHSTPVIYDDYTPPKRREHPPNAQPMSPRDSRRKTWSPASFNRIHIHGNQLTLRSYSNEQLDVANKEDIMTSRNEDFDRNGDVVIDRNQDVMSNRSKYVMNGGDIVTAAKIENVMAINEGAVTEEETDFEEENIYEELELRSPKAPPKLAPVSGRLENTQVGTQTFYSSTSVTHGTSDVYPYILGVMYYVFHVF